MTTGMTDTERQLVFVARKTAYNANEHGDKENELVHKIRYLSKDRGITNLTILDRNHIDKLKAQKELLLLYIRRLQFFILCIPKEAKDRARATIAGHRAEIQRIEDELNILQV